MKQGKKFLAIVPAREGSKGIKDKNICKLDGKPLIAHTIEEGLKSKYIDNIVVSTDGVKIQEVAKKYGAEVPFLRPKRLATDIAKSIDCVIHCIEELKKIGLEYDYVILLQPTQPFRRSWHIDEAIELILEKYEDSLVSVSKVRDHPILIRTIDDNGQAINLLRESSTIRRQDFKDYYKVNGAIYINNINNITSQTSLNDNKLAYIMDGKYDIDIDEALDLKIAEVAISEIK